MSTHPSPTGCHPPRLTPAVQRVIEWHRGKQAAAVAALRASIVAGRVEGAAAEPRPNGATA